MDVTQSSLENRAYIVSRDSDDLTVIDLGSLEVIGRVKTGGVQDHMGDLNADFTKLFIDSSETNEAVIVGVGHRGSILRSIQGILEVTLRHENRPSRFQKDRRGRECTGLKQSVCGAEMSAV